MDDVKAALRQFRERALDYRRYADYYQGRQRLTFATEKFRSAFGQLFSAFADNLCPPVVDAIADRLQLVGFGVEEGPEDAATSAWALWTRNRMDRLAGEVHLEALSSGDAYLIVWPGLDGQPVFYPNEATVMTVRYEAETPGLMRWAAKLWKMDDGGGRLRLNLYYPDRIEKYATASKVEGIPDDEGRFQPFEVEGEPWPLPNPWERVPVFHFANNGRIGCLGYSELRDVVPLQDALNKSVADMLVAMEYVALPQRWATGLETDIDETTGKAKPPFTPGADRVWAVGDPDVKFGQFEAANLSQLLEVQEKFRAEIARVSGTPLHYMMLQSGEFPSGEAMKTAEARFLSKVTDRQAAFGNVWEDALRFALRLMGKPDARLSALWKDPTPRSEKEMAEVALLKQQAGVSKEQILRELGYSPQQIEQMAKETEADAAAMADSMLNAFEKDTAVA